MITAEATVKQIAETSFKQIAESKKIALICHKKPDMDALSSMIALKRLIKNNLNKEENSKHIDMFVDVENFDKTFLPIINDEIFNPEIKGKYDLAISVDCSNLKRLGKYSALFKNTKDTLNIDHHATNTKFAKNNIVIKNCSSSAEAIYQIFCKQLGFKCTIDIYSLIYSGIITDTNNFSQNTNASTLKITYELYEKCTKQGYNLDHLRNYFFQNKTKQQLALLSRALKSLSFVENGRIATMKIIKKDFIASEATQNDTFGIVDYACALEGVEIGILFIKQKNNAYYISLRSKGEIDVGQIAKDMGGGGSKNIAAFETHPQDNLTYIKAKLFFLCRLSLEQEHPNMLKITDYFREQQKS